MPDRKNGTTAQAAKTYTISLANRKARGSGHERKGEILAAARSLFVEHGFENVSTRKIAEPRLLGSRIPTSALTQSFKVHRMPVQFNGDILNARGA